MYFHGPVPLDEISYVDREFQLRLIREVQAGHWVLLLGPRQHGKTSAFLRVRASLVEHGTCTVLVDLQKMPPFERYAQLVTWFAKEVAKLIGHPVEIPETDDFASAIFQALPEGTYPVVILIDEASSIRDDGWRNAFFGQIRAISSEQGVAGPTQVAKRLRFVFAGTFRPEQLVAEQNSPFNICERIDTEDLLPNHVSKLAADAGIENPEGAASLIYESVGGQPYLAQRLIYAAVGKEDSIAAVADELARLRDGEGEHINNLFRRIVSEENLVAIVAEVLADGAIANEAGNEDHRYLTVLGMLPNWRKAPVPKQALWRGRGPKPAVYQSSDPGGSTRTNLPAAT